MAMAMATKLSVVPPLVALCADLLLQKPPPITALSFPDPPAGQAVSRASNKLIYHPPSDSCVLRQSLNDPLKLGPCNQSDTWSYTPQKFLVVKGTYFCLQAVDSGNPARLAIICSVSDSQWDEASTSDAKPFLSTMGIDGSSLCLDVDADNTLVTNPCVCPSSESCDPGSQWFEIDTYNRDSNAAAPSN